jgi:hypothetical protein
MRRVATVIALSLLISAHLSSETVHQSATVTMADAGTIEVRFEFPASLASEYNDIDVLLTLNGAEETEAGPLAVELSGEFIDFAVDELPHSLPGGCELPGPPDCEFTVTAKWTEHVETPPEPEQYLIQLKRINNGDWPQVGVIRVTLPDPADDSIYQLDVDVSSGDPVEQEWIASAIPNRRIAAQPEWATLVFPPAQFEDELTITPMIPDTPGPRAILVWIALGHGTDPYVFSADDVSVYVGDQEILHGGSGSTGLTVEFLAPGPVPYSSPLLRITGAEGATGWPMLDQIVIDTSDFEGQTFELAIAIEAISERPDGLGLAAVWPRAEPMEPPVLIGWQDGPLSPDATATLEFRTDGLQPDLFSNAVLDPAAADPFSDSLDDTDSGGHYIYTVQAGAVVNTGGEATLTISDPVSPDLMVVKGQITSWKIRFRTAADSQPPFFLLQQPASPFPNPIGIRIK